MANSISILFWTVPPSIYIRVPRNPDVPRTVLETVDFTCLSFGDPAPIVIWEKDGVMVEDGERFRILSDSFGQYDSTLSISQAKATDTGSYRCVSSNPAGEDSELFELTVTGIIWHAHAHTHTHIGFCSCLALSSHYIQGHPM